MGKTAFLSEAGALQMLRRYSAVTVMRLLREVARCDNARLDWNVLVRTTNTGISSAREYQALWRHIAYRTELDDFYSDNAQPSDDDSDLEFELLPARAVSSDASAEVVRWVKADMHRFDVSSRKKGEMLGKSKSRVRGLPTVSNQARLSGSARDGSDKGAAMASNEAAGDSSTASLPPETACQLSLASHEGTLSHVALGQSERKKRKLWSAEEDQELISAVEKFGEGNWTNILKGSFTHERTAAQLSQRWALIRKRRGVEAVACKLATTTPTDGQDCGIQTPPADPSHGTNPAQTLGTNPAQNGDDVVNISRSMPPSAAGGSASVNEVVEASTAMGSLPSPSGSESQVHVTSSPNASSGSTGVNIAMNGSVSPLGLMESSTLKGGIVQSGGKSMQAGTNGGRARAGSAARSTLGSSTAGRSAGAKRVSAGSGVGRLIAPGALVMSAAAAQAASVGGSEMWEAATLPTAGAQSSGPAKYVIGTNSGVASCRGMSMKLQTGPDPGVQAAAFAAGARIAPASAAASLLKASHSGNVVHTGLGGVTAAISGLPSQTAMEPNASVGPIVHYICTGAGAPPSPGQGVTLSCPRPPQQTRNQTEKAPSN